MTPALPANLDVVDDLLDTAHPPVARLRILSAGLAPNHTLDGHDLAGSEACLACGSCVDACPVVASKPQGTMFVRTSMLLEHVVGRSCRRCYRCVAACPQVTLELKEYARGFRAPERCAHAMLVVAYLSLMTSGLLVHYWGPRLPADLHRLLGALHRTAAPLLLLAPVLLFTLDRAHFTMALRRSLSWSAADASWFRAAGRWLASAGRAGGLGRGAFNPGQRLWILYVGLALATFGATGALRWLGPEVVGDATARGARSAHVAAAIASDVLVLLHAWLKLGWPAARGVARRTRIVLAHRRRRARRAGGLFNAV